MRTATSDTASQGASQGGVEKPKGMPDHWEQNPGNKPGVREWVNPDNTGDRVRSYPGTPDSSNPRQREPYVRDVRSGNQWLDENGSRVKDAEGRDSPTTHIPTKDYKFPQ